MKRKSGEMRSSRYRLNTAIYKFNYLIINVLFVLCYTGVFMLFFVYKSRIKRFVNYVLLVPMSTYSLIPKVYILVCGRNIQADETINNVKLKRSTFACIRSSSIFPMHVLRFYWLGS